MEKEPWGQNPREGRGEGHRGLAAHRGMSGCDLIHGEGAEGRGSSPETGAVEDTGALRN